MQFIKKLFGLNKEPEFDIEKAVGELLLNLPGCSKYVVVISPKYGDKYYNCEVVAETQYLSEWAANHAEVVLNFNKEEQAARVALPHWLRSADLSNKHWTYVTYYFHKVLSPYALDFINKDFAEIYCLECESIVKNIKMEEFDKKKSGGYVWWTDLWTCPEGHELHYQKKQIHFIY